MARPKVNPVIALTKKLVSLQVRNEKLQQDIADTLDAITKELEQQTLDSTLTPVNTPAPVKSRGIKKVPVDAVVPKKRGRPSKKV
ncbi:MAG: hypothetical protein CVV47_07065 [Spirochaetae bacterium HGW-Spirochaetae-3]|jgi:hypothetical protein|nr:MAG: hypothetical protein CVV47_07065 [Spirochaetae bacterium HGW-Spirochaetae-3]